MFLNQVIKDIEYEEELRKKFIKAMEAGRVKDPRWDIVEEHQALIELETRHANLQNSVQFYLGDYGDWQGSMKRLHDIPLFDHCNLQLPWDPCSFSLTLNNKTLKVLVLATKDQDEDLTCDRYTFSFAYKGQVPGEVHWTHYLVSYSYILDGTVITQYPEGDSRREHFKKMPSEKIGNVMAKMPSKEHADSIEINREMVISCMSLIYTALDFMQCKNVVSEYVYTSKQGMFNNIPTERRNLFRYKVLKILVPKSRKYYVYNTTKGTEMTTMPLHVVVAHKKTYTEDRPLFGKYVGEWAWQQFTRGDIANGSITKDYCVKLKKQKGD